MNIQKFLTGDQQQQIIAAIRMAETNTSGEIRLHISKTSNGNDPMVEALNIFNQLEMYKTGQRNGVLFYISVADRKFAIIGDQGINEIVPPDFWEDIKNMVILHFRQQNYVQGLTEGIKMAGMKLKEHFPYQKDDVNELSDDISFQE